MNKNIFQKDLNYALQETSTNKSLSKLHKVFESISLKEEKQVSRNLKKEKANSFDKRYTYPMD